MHLAVRSLQQVNQRRPAPVSLERVGEAKGLQKWIQGAANYASSLLMYFCAACTHSGRQPRHLSKDLRRQGRPLELNNQLCGVGGEVGGWSYYAIMMS